MPIDGPLMGPIDGPHGTAMALDELRWDLSTGIQILEFETQYTIAMRASNANGRWFDVCVGLNIFICNFLTCQRVFLFSSLKGQILSFSTLFDFLNIYFFVHLGISFFSIKNGVF